MRRSFRLIMLSSICCLLFGNCRTSFVSDCLIEDIVFLDDDKSNNLAKKKNLQSCDTSDIVLNEATSAYVLNASSFARIDSENANNYLKKGGIITVDDNCVTSEELKEKIDCSVADFNYSNDHENYGFFIKNIDGINVVVNVSAGFLSDSFNEKGLQKDSIDKHSVALSMVESARGHNFYLDDGKGGGGGGSGQTIDTNTSGEIIAYSYMENILFLEGTASKICSYTIYTNVFDVAKFKDNSTNKICGIYDISTDFTIDAEDGFAVTDYSVRMLSQETVVDCSYLNSDTNTTVSLEGSLGFDGNKLQGSLSGGISYTYSPDSQSIVNDLPAGKIKTWNSHVISPTNNASRRIKPAIRIVNSDDRLLTLEELRVDTLFVKTYPSFSTTLEMIPKYRKASLISFNKYGNISQSEIIG
jgi:hypothetical protein